MIKFPLGSNTIINSLLLEGLYNFLNGKLPMISKFILEGSIVLSSG